jgi:hypothetical protein
LVAAAEAAEIVVAAVVLAALGLPMDSVLLPALNTMLQWVLAGMAEVHPLMELQEVILFFLVSLQMAADLVQ